jgi:aryl-alcohol dehydrogenase-like predicted oxidoreductase
MVPMNLGHTNEEIPPIGFGGMPLSIQGRPSTEQAKKTLNAAIDAGMTFIDTADVYCFDDFDTGHNERLIASVLRERSDGKSIQVATKAGLERPNGAWTRNGSPEHIREACEQSLLALGVEQIWLYQYHAPDEKFPFEESVGAFAELQRAGKCKYVGLSNVTVEEIERAKKVVDVQSVQNRLNPYFRESVEVARWCGENAITFLAYSPLGGGRLTKKLPKFEVLQTIAKNHDASVHAVTIAWVRAQGKSIVPIPAASTPEHAIDSAKSVAITLTTDELSAIDDADFDRT